MEAVKVDDQNRVRLTIFKPGDYYRPEFQGPELVVLRRVEESEAMETETVDINDVDPVTLLPKSRKLKISPASIVAAVKAARKHK